MERERVLRRAMESCERCGTWSGLAWSIHHRRPRKMGGTKQLERLSNLVLLCGSGTTGCHGWVEKHRTMAFGLGWLVHQWDDPAAVAVCRRGCWVLLTDDGGIVPSSPVQG